MLLRWLAMVGLAALVLSVAFSVWRSGIVRAWLTTAPDSPPQIVFDNGSVRDAPMPAASEPTKTAALSPPGVLRKCVRGDRVTYSNLTCPPGFRERPVSQEGVTVLPAPRPVAGSVPGSPATPHEKMRSALDMQRDEKLRQRMIDKAVDAEAK
jgi:hypothetical protein